MIIHRNIVDVLCCSDVADIAYETEFVFMNQYSDMALCFHCIQYL